MAPTRKGLAQRLTPFLIRPGNGRQSATAEAAGVAAARRYSGLPLFTAPALKILGRCKSRRIRARLCDIGCPAARRRTILSARDSRLQADSASGPARTLGTNRAAPVEPAPAAETAGSDAATSSETDLVCIVSRKELRNITRVPRMAKALCDAGYGVVVVSLGAPVEQLRALCPVVEYIAVTPRPFTGRLLSWLNGRVRAQANRRDRRARRDAEFLELGGWHALAVGVRRAVLGPPSWLGRFASRFLLAPAGAALLQTPDQGFFAAWRELSRRPAAGIVALLVRTLHTKATTRAFAAAADRATRDRCFRIVQAHDNYALVAADRLARRDKARLIYDAVELTKHRLGTNFNPLETLFEWSDRRNEAAIFHKAAAVTTVGAGVAQWYERHYRIAAPQVIRNCRYYWPYVRDDRLRSDIGIGAEVPLVVWFGGIYPQQGVETLIDVVPLLDPQIHIAIIAYVLPRWARYIEHDLPHHAAKLGVSERVHFLPPQEPEDLVPYVSGADLGVIPRPSEHLNNFLSMPNKFLEMVMARLPVAVSRLGDIVDVVTQYDIGDSFDERDLRDTARVIDRLLKRPNNLRLKANVMKAAEELTWEQESLRYVALVRCVAQAGKDIAKRYSRGAPAGNSSPPLPAP